MQTPHMLGALIAMVQNVWFLAQILDRDVGINHLLMSSDTTYYVAVEEMVHVIFNNVK